MAKNINQPPKYCKDAIATNVGWKHPKTGELLISNKSLNLAEIEALGDLEDDVSADVETIVEDVEPIVETIVEDVEPIVETIVEDVEPIVEQLEEEIIDYDEMTKSQLVSYAKDIFDVDLPKKDNKTTLINKIKDLNE